RARMSASSISIRPSEHLAGRDTSVIASRGSHVDDIPLPTHEEIAPLASGVQLSPTLDAPMRIGSASGIQLRIHGDLEEVGEEWKSLAQAADGTAFQSFEWLSAWQRHIGTARGTVPVIALGHDGDGELLFLLPLAIESSGSVRRLTFLGSQLCDYNAP